MPFRPDTVRGSDVRGPGEIDYRLARHGVVSEFRKGRLARHEVCDAHPELLRAAREVGDRTSQDCPICADDQVVLVSYVFGPRLPAFGRCITSKAELRAAGRAVRLVHLLRGRGLPGVRLEPPGPHVPAEPADVPGRRLPLSRRPTAPRNGRRRLVASRQARRSPLPRRAPTLRSLPITMRTPRAIAAHNVKTTRSGKVKRRSIVWRMRRWLFLAGLLVVTGFAGVLYLLSTVDLPAPPREVDQTTFVCDASVPVGQCTSANAMAAFHGSENRVEVTPRPGAEGHAGRGARLRGP